MGEHIIITASDGHQLDTYCARPTGKPRGALVVIQEIFGVNGHIRNVCDRLAKEGYSTIAPALFDRTQQGVELDYTPEDKARGRELRSQVSLDHVINDMRAAASMAGSFGKVGTVGFCWGGSLAWLAATRLGLPSVCYYGGNIIDFIEEKLQAPVLLHFGETDASIPIHTVEEIRSAHPTVPTHLYPAGHGFNCDRRADYHKASAHTAFARTLGFLAEHVG